VSEFATCMVIPILSFIMGKPLEGIASISVYIAWCVYKIKETKA
jgi:hypothetical protein